MAIASNFIIQRISDGDYKTESGWDSSIAFAKVYSSSVNVTDIINSFSNGDYIVIRVLTKS